jgi:hypothetical protein
MMNDLILPITAVKRRGRPCASERYNNELMQQKLTSIVNSNRDINDDFARLNVIPLIMKRQRRVRANDRERNRMQTLNEALFVLQQHLPIDFLLSLNLIPTQSLDSSISSDSNANTKSKNKKSQEPKLTKIDTLKLATKYIEMLTNFLREDDLKSSNSSNQTASVSSSSSSSSPEFNSYSYDDFKQHNTELNDYMDIKQVNELEFNKKENPAYAINQNYNSYQNFKLNQEDHNHNTIQFYSNCNNENNANSYFNHYHNHQNNYFNLNYHSNFRYNTNNGYV